MHSSVLCLVAVAGVLTGCQSTDPDRDALRERWHSDESRAKVLPKPEPWMELEAPGDGARIDAVVPLVEVRGHAGAGAHGPQDIVLVIDTSGSVFTASGIDLDGDGIVGGSLCNPYCGYAVRSWTSDFDDIVLKVEIDAAQKLVTQLDPATTRMGLVKFGDTAWVEEPVGSLSSLSQSLIQFRYVMRGGTDLIGALHKAIDSLEDAPPLADGTQPQRAILFLTDGVDSVQWPRDYERHDYLHGLLVRARAAHVRIFSFGIGPQAKEDLLEVFATETGGRDAMVPASRDIALELQLLGLTGLADVELRNTTTGAPGRAVRVFPNGSFDGYLPLVAGDNDLGITATLLDGRRVESRARVHFESPAHPTEAQLAAAEKLAATLRDRTVATDLSIRVETERRRRARELTIKPEP